MIESPSQSRRETQSRGVYIHFYLTGTVGDVFIYSSSQLIMNQSRNSDQRTCQHSSKVCRVTYLLVVGSDVQGVLVRLLILSIIIIIII